MNNERLKILADTLVKLAELWGATNSSEDKYSIYAQIDMIRKLIREECRK